MKREDSLDFHLPVLRPGFYVGIDPSGPDQTFETIGELLPSGKIRYQVQKLRRPYCSIRHLPDGSFEHTIPPESSTWADLWQAVAGVRPCPEIEGMSRHKLALLVLAAHAARAGIEHCSKILDAHVSPGLDPGSWTPTFQVDSEGDGRFDAWEEAGKFVSEMEDAIGGRRGRWIRDRVCVFVND